MRFCILICFVLSLMWSCTQLESPVSQVVTSSGDCPQNFWIELPSKEKICAFNYRETVAPEKMYQAICNFAGGLARDVCGNEEVLISYRDAYSSIVSDIRTSSPAFQQLSLSELLGIHFYIGDMYKMLGKIFAGAGSDSEILVYEPVVRSIVSALNGLPSYNGKVYSGTVVAKDQFENLFKNGEFRKQGFLSTSTKIDVAENFNNPAHPESQYSVMLVINGKSGRNISAANEFGEMEVLFHPYFPFQIEHIQAGQYQDPLSRAIVEQRTVYLNELKRL